jgi:hypothetical protein
VALRSSSAPGAGWLRPAGDPRDELDLWAVAIDDLGAVVDEDWFLHRNGSDERELEELLMTLDDLADPGA